MARIELLATIQPTVDDPMIPVRLLVSQEVASLPVDEAKKTIGSLLHEIRIRPEFVLYGFRTTAAYVDPLPRSQLFGHNTLVEVSLPYTLHLPSGVPFDVSCADGRKAIVVLRKLWTERAAGSSTTEIYADNQLLYYGDTHLASPTSPQPPELGPHPQFTGTNVEITGDTHGVFRYTKIHVLFDSTTIVQDPSSDEDNQAANSLAYDSATETTREIVNYLLDVYRYVTAAEHVERLSAINVNRVYFADQNLLFEGLGIEAGLGSAIVNRSRFEIERIREMLQAGAEPERHVLLLQSSRAALGRGQLVLAIVAAFQSLEILLETKLRDAYLRLGLSDAGITSKLKKFYRTKDRLTVLCREVTGGRSVADDNVFWDSWLIECNRKRNGVIHKNELVSRIETVRIVELCEQCIGRLLALPFPA
jgi:hypothetical protein